MEQKQVQIIDGIISCDIDITKDEWKKILTDKITYSTYSDALIKFYLEPGHKSTCTNLGTKYGVSPQSFNSRICAFAKAVQKSLNRFEINDPKNKYWLIPMTGKSLDDNHFEYTIRPELVAAMEEIGMTTLEYHKFSWIPFYEEFANKLLEYKDNRKGLLDVIYSEKLIPFTSYIKEEDGSHSGDICPFTVFGVFNRGLTDNNRTIICEIFKNAFSLKADIPDDFAGIPIVDNRRACFYNAKGDRGISDIDNLWNLFEATIEKNQETFEQYYNKVIKQKGINWNITMGLFWIRPNKYLALDGKNREYLTKKYNYNEIKVIPIAADYKALMNKVETGMKNNEIAEKSFPEFSFQSWLYSPINYWLVGYTFEEVSQFDRFLGEGIWEGYSNIKAQIDLLKSVKEQDIIILKAAATKGEGHKIGFTRIRAIGMVTDIIENGENEQNKFSFKVQYINTNEKDFDGKSYLSTIHQLKDAQIKKYVDNEIMNGEHLKIMPIEIKHETKYDKYISLLEHKHNLIFTGAPGTGKTYLAERIAEAMDAETEFVQFHPSYDYTDFVEGLRPIDKDNDNIGFRRQDGIFKSFCKRAIINLKDSEKSEYQIAEIDSITKQILDFANDAIENKKKLSIKSGNEFSIVGYDDNNITINTPSNAITTTLNIRVNEIREILLNNIKLKDVKDIRDFFKRKFPTQNDSYTFAICNELSQWKVKNTERTKVIPLKNHVFIIDEINRGEISKIFGELFYSIDPDYRLSIQQIKNLELSDETNETVIKQQLVKTQYQNLVKDDDEFYRGFYIPDNVYIIGTMNDIDRSVESMDFAMRRRFAWYEITAEESAENMGNLLSEESKKRMMSLNKKITATQGLGAEYNIGAAYFLKLGDDSYDNLWKYHIKGVLSEYLRGMENKDDILKALKKAYDVNDEAKATTEEEVNDTDN